MRGLESCLVCGGTTFAERFPATFQGTWEEAVPFFLGQRSRAVRGRIVQCRDCGFVATSPQFPAEEYARIYGAVRRRPRPDPGETHRFRRLRERVLHHVRGGRFLDFGSGSGGFLRAMAETPGFEGQGFEVRDTEGGFVAVDSTTMAGDFVAFAGHGAGGRYEFITAWDVLEHIPDLDRTMAALGDCLRDGGILFCTVPDVSSLAARLSGASWNCYLLEHLWYFSPDTLRRYASRCGFSVLELAPVSYPVALGAVAQRVGQTYGLPLPLPEMMRDWVVRLPIGLMFAALAKEKK